MHARRPSCWMACACAGVRPTSLNSSSQESWGMVPKTLMMRPWQLTLCCGYWVVRNSMCMVTMGALWPFLLPPRAVAMPRIRGSAIWSCMRFWASWTSEQRIILCLRVSVLRLQRTHYVLGTSLLLLETTVAVGKQKLSAWRKFHRVFSGMVLSCITSPRISLQLPSMRMKSELFA
eukprot:3277894-Rhodomonas_salina.2